MFSAVSMLVPVYLSRKIDLSRSKEIGMCSITSMLVYILAVCNEVTCS